MRVIALTTKQKVHISAVGEFAVDGSPQSAGDRLEVCGAFRILGNQLKQTFAFVYVRHKLDGSHMPTLAGGFVMKVINLDGNFSALLGNWIGASRTWLTILLMTSQQPPVS